MRQNYKLRGSLKSCLLPTHQSFLYYLPFSFSSRLIPRNPLLCFADSCFISFKLIVFEKRTIEGRKRLVSRGDIQEGEHSEAQISKGFKSCGGELMRCLNIILLSSLCPFCHANYFRPSCIRLSYGEMNSKQEAHRLKISIIRLIFPTCRLHMYKIDYITHVLMMNICR